MIRRFAAIRAADELAWQMASVGAGWYLYTTTHNPMSLAYAGIVQFLANACMALIAGQVVDRFDRRKVIAVAFLVHALALAAFATRNAHGNLAAGMVYLLLFVLGSAHAFSSPALSAVLPQVADAEAFPKAVAMTSSVLQVCSIAGPATGGLLMAFNGPAMFAFAAALYGFALAQTLNLPPCRCASQPADDGVLAGIRYVWANRLLLALTSLDLFAVLLGGVTALLPIYASDILSVGPGGLGCLRCAPGIGALVAGFFLVKTSIARGAGRVMLSCVAAFGLATVVFAVSTNFCLSLAALLAAGAFDMVSMVIRETLLQTSTPDTMRGRVSAVNGLFIGASSEIGAFESGATAAFWGAVPAALVGGLGTLVVVGLWSWLFPELLRARTISRQAKACRPDDLPPPKPGLAPSRLRNAAMKS